MVQFYSANDLAKITGNSLAWGRKTLQLLNNRLKDQGFLTIKGRVPSQVFEQAFGIKKEEER